MWIYCNPNGNIVSVCYDRNIMQGNDLDIVVCFPDEARFLGQALTLHFKVNGQDITVGNLLGGSGGAVKTFQGVNPESYVTNHDVGAFVKGKKYVMYDIPVSSAHGVTSVYGNISFYIVMSPYGNVGAGSIYVQKTYGNGRPTGITNSEYSDIMNGLKKSMFFTEFPMSMKGNSNGKIAIYAWRNVGYIFGKFTIGEIAESEEGEYVPIADSDPLFCNSLPCTTVFGTGSNGEDYEFKLVPNETTVYDEATGIPTGERKTVLTLFLNPKSYVAENKDDEVFISGIFEFTGYIAGFSNGTEDSTEYTIRKVTASAHDGDEVGVNLSFEKNEDNVDTMNFDFTIPVPKPVSNVQGTNVIWQRKIVNISNAGSGDVYHASNSTIDPSGTELYTIIIENIYGIIGNEELGNHPELSVMLSYKENVNSSDIITPVIVRITDKTMKILYALDRGKADEKPQFVIISWIEGGRIA